MCIFSKSARYCVERGTTVPDFKINRETTMLVLSRKLGEKIVIGDNIVVTVVKIDRNQIRIGIEAPSDILVYREEIAPQRGAREERTGPVALSRS
jgi:carbon storage regulator